jgi:hypothetical protein
MPSLLGPRFALLLSFLLISCSEEKYRIGFPSDIFRVFERDIVSAGINLDLEWIWVIVMKCPWKMESYGIVIFIEIQWIIIVEQSTTSTVPVPNTSSSCSNRIWDLNSWMNQLVGV